MDVAEIVYKKSEFIETVKDFFSVQFRKILIKYLKISLVLVEWKQSKQKLSYVRFSKYNIARQNCGLTRLHSQGRFGGS